jgi:hypothetical protein
VAELADALNSKSTAMLGKRCAVAILLQLATEFEPPLHRIAPESFLIDDGEWSGHNQQGKHK